MPGLTLNCPGCGRSTLLSAAESGSPPARCPHCQTAYPSASYAASPAGAVAHTDTMAQEGSTHPRSGATRGAMPQRIHHYRILSELGRGGMGAVYKAEHEMLRRIVALKVLKQELTSGAEFIERFKREMLAVGRLDHPNIVRALDAGESGGTLYLAMEYVPGHDLQQHLLKRVRLPLQEACDLIRQAATGLQHAHENRLVHRDIKPSNLLLNTQGQVKILDLGLARLTGEDRPAADISYGMCLGTPDYMAPEQWESLIEVDGRADLYSLGCTLFAFLAGRPPFAEAASIPAKGVAHMRTPIPDVRKFAPEVPAPVAILINRLLAKERDNRPASAAEVVSILSPFCNQGAPLFFPDPSSASNTVTEPAGTNPSGSSVLGRAPTGPVSMPPRLPANPLDSSRSDSSRSSKQPPPMQSGTAPAQFPGRLPPTPPGGESSGSSLNRPLSVGESSRAGGAPGSGSGRRPPTIRPAGSDPRSSGTLPVVGGPTPIPVVPRELPGARQRRAAAYPQSAFCLVIYNLSLIFLILRVFDVAFSMSRLLLASSESTPWLITDTFHLLAGLGMVLVGIPANLLLLFGKPSGRVLGWFLVMFVVGSIQVDLCRWLIFQSQHASGSGGQMFALFGLGGELLFRGTLLAFYVTALIQFAKWLRGRPA